MRIDNMIIIFYAYLALPILFLLYVIFVGLLSARENDPGLVTDNVKAYGAFLGVEIPNILAIIAFSEFMAVLYRNQLIFSVISWLLFVYLMLKSREQINDICSLQGDVEKHRHIRNTWFALSAFTTVLSNVLISFMVGRLLSLHG